MKELAMEDIPKWDVALESLAKDECAKLGRPLELSDFKELGKVYKIRFDDLMHTLCQLVENEMWDQVGTDDSGNQVDAAELEDLFVYNRLDEKIAQKYHVKWQPNAQAYAGA